MTKLKFGCANDQGAPNVRFGLHKGFYRDEGIELEIHRVYGGPELAAEFSAGRVQIGEFGAPPALTAIAKGCPIKIIASGTRKKFMMTLAVRQDIADWPALKGAKVGLLSPGSCTEWLAREMWRKHGLDPETDLEFVILRESHTRIVEEMRDGKFDAFMATEPKLTAAEREGLVSAWGNGWDPDYLPRYQWGVMVATPDFIANEPELVRKVVAASVRASRYGAEHPEEWAAFQAEYFNIDPVIAEEALRRTLPLLELDGVLDMEGLDRAIELQASLGAYQAGDAPSAAEIVDERFIPARIAA